jgi:hypothetical protein
MTGFYPFCWNISIVMSHFCWKMHTAYLPERNKAKQKQPCTGLDRPWGFPEFQAPGFLDNQHMKVVRLLALCTGHLYPPRDSHSTRFCYGLSAPQGHNAVRRIKSMKKSSDTIRNWTHDIPAGIARTWQKDNLKSKATPFWKTWRMKKLPLWAKETRVEQM